MFSNVIRKAKRDDEPLDADKILGYWKALASEHPQALLDEKTLRWMERRQRIIRRKTRWTNG
ncbi:MAG: hypothetical protein GY953_49570 [bacterium]|nr:hypothetical protein [bacterium]